MSVDGQGRVITAFCIYGKSVSQLWELGEMAVAPGKEQRGIGAAWRSQPWGLGEIAVAGTQLEQAWIEITYNMDTCTYM